MLPEFKPSTAKLELYLSYSAACEQKFPLTEAFQKACFQHSIHLCCPREEALGEIGVNQFLDHFSERCWVAVALSPSYMRSPSCMREFIDLTECQLTEGRVLPFFHEAVDSAEMQEIHEIHWNDREFLSRLHYPGETYLELSDRIHRGFEHLLRPFIERANPPIRAQNSEIDYFLRQIVEQAEQEQKSALERLDRHLKTNLTRILDQSAFTRFRRKLSISEDAAQSTAPGKCAHSLIVLTIDDALDKLLDLTEKYPPAEGSQSEIIERYWKGVESLCGWLILASTRPQWWLQNPFKQYRLKRNGLQAPSDFDQDTPVDVAFSRLDFSQPLREFSTAKPGERFAAIPENVINLVIPDDDRFKIFILDLYKDLFREDPRVSDPRRLTELLIARIRNRIQKTGPIYYLVGSDRYTRLGNMGLLDRIDQAFAARLQVIEIEETSHLSHNHTQISQVLRKIAWLFELSREARTHYDSY